MACSVPGFLKSCHMYLDSGLTIFYVCISFLSLLFFVLLWCWVSDPLLCPLLFFPFLLFLFFLLYLFSLSGIPAYTFPDYLLRSLLDQTSVLGSFTELNKCNMKECNTSLHHLNKHFTAKTHLQLIFPKRGELGAW